MGILKAAFITAMGFGLGMVLAGVGGLSAKPFSLFSSSAESTQKIEKYWQETGLSANEVKSLISSEKCYSSQKYYQACLNAVLQNALKLSLKISNTTGELIALNPLDRLEEKSEKQLIQSFGKSQAYINFDSILDRLIELESQARKSTQAASLINSFMSVYFDPHTYILPANFYEEVGSKIERSKYFVGISYEKENGSFFIRKVSKNSDADLASLKVNDEILSINSVAVKDLKYSDVSSLLRNENTAVIKFVVLRNSKIINISMQRSFRNLSYVQYETIKAEKSYGVLTLAKFNRGACAEVANSLLVAQKDHVEGLVLDLRDNPGGLLSEAACIEGLLLGEDKKAYYVEYFDISKANEVALTSEKQMYKGPLIVLVNSFSASASELLAGGLQEYKRALIMGERTFGKGTFQEPEEWVLNAKINLFKTQGLYLLPSRNSTQLVGVKPDVELPPDINAKREEQLFLNPISVTSRKYAQLKKSDLERSFVFSHKCSQASARTSFEDFYLQEGLKYLNCAKAPDAVASSNSDSVLN